MEKAEHSGEDGSGILRRPHVSHLDRLLVAPPPPPRRAATAASSRRNPQVARKERKNSENAMLVPLHRPAPPTWGHKRHPRLPLPKDLYRFPTSAPRRSRRNFPRTGKLGIRPLIGFGAVCTVPPKALSTNEDINKRNEATVELYTEMGRILKKKHLSIVASKVIKAQGDGVTAEYAGGSIGANRTEAAKLRREVASMGGTPIMEPASYCEIFYYARF